jgi:hypothetical protein
MGQKRVLYCHKIHGQEDLKAFRDSDLDLQRGFKEGEGVGKKW